MNRLIRAAWRRWLAPAHRSVDKGNWARLLVDALEERAVPTAYTVTSLADATNSYAAGTLRYAIQQANLDTDPAGATIGFNVPGGGTVQLAQQLPVLDNPFGISIDGSNGGANNITISGSKSITVGTTTLGSAIADTTGTSITLGTSTLSALGLNFGAGGGNGNYRNILKIDGEEMLAATGAEGNPTISVLRGYNGTTAATHSSGATVTVSVPDRILFIGITSDSPMASVSATPANTSFVVKNVTLANGMAQGGYGQGGGGGGGGLGGAIFLNAGTLSLNNVTFTNNGAVGGANNWNTTAQSGSPGGGGGMGGRGGSGATSASKYGGGGGGFGTIGSTGVAPDGGRGGNFGPGEFTDGTHDGGSGGSGVTKSNQPTQLSGGGGSSGNTSPSSNNQAGGGGGVGANSAGPVSVGGKGGFGGGGGGGSATPGGAGGYGGGGGGGGGAGGFGGGGGGSGAGGFAGGSGGGNASANGGGGAGLGGAVFVRQGATLNMTGVSFTGGAAVGAPVNGGAGSPGQGIGAAIFVAGTAQYTVSSGTTTVSNDIGGATRNSTTLAMPNTTALSAAVTTTSATSVSLSSATAIGTLTNGTSVIQIDGEQMLVTAGAGTTTLTVTRGTNSTTAATHLSAAVVFNVTAISANATTLSAAVTTTTETSLTITNAAALGTLVNGANVIQVDGELMLVTGGAGTASLTVTRGYFGTTAATHVSGAFVVNATAITAIGSGASIPLISATALGTIVNNSSILQIGGEQMLVTAGAGTATLTVTRGYNGTAVVSHSADSIVTQSSTLVSGGFTKSGSGTLSLASTTGNSYTGGTTVSVGTLQVANASGSATGPGPVVVQSGATLGAAGSARISGPVSVNAGGGIAALSTATITFSSGLTLDADNAAVSPTATFTLTGAPTANPLINVQTTNGLLVNSAGKTNVVVAAASTPAPGTYHLFQYVGSNPFANFNTTVTGGPAGFTYTLVDNASAQEIDLLVAYAPPTLAKGGSPLTSYNSGSPATVLDAGLSVTDSSGASLAFSGATVSIVGGFDSASDTLAWANPDDPTMSGSFDTGSGVFTISGSDTLANYQAALRSITFVTASASTAQRTITVTATDSAGSSNALSYSITVNVLTQTLDHIAVSPASANVNAAGSQTFTAIGYDASNVPLTNQPTFVWSSNAAAGTIDSGTGVLTAAQATGVGTVYATVGSVQGSASVTVTNHAPTVATQPTADGTTNDTITGTTAALAVLGADQDTPESTLIYTWSAVSVPSGGGVDFGATNGFNAGKNLTATFTRAGTYVLQVTIADPGLESVTSSVISVTAVSTVSSVSVSPPSISLYVSDTLPFFAIANDQFNQPVPVTWSATAGSIDGSGVFTAPTSAGSVTVTAAVGSVTGAGSVTVTNPFVVTTTINGGAEGDGSLRTAINDAQNDNRFSGTRTITFDPSLFTDGAATIQLTSSINDYTSIGASSFVIGKSIVIQGPAADGLTSDNRLTIRGGGAASKFRFATISATGNLTLANVTLTNFYEQGGNGGLSNSGGGGGLGAGGAILNYRGALTLNGVTIADCTTQGGAGISGSGTHTVGTTLYGGAGGGMGTSASGTVPGGPSGGIGTGGQFGGAGAGFGGGGVGGGYSYGWVGWAGGFGGGGGGGASDTGGAGGFGAGDGNTTGKGGGGAGLGGAIFNLGGSVTVVNSTLTANSAIGGAGGASNAGFGLGGAIFNLNGTLTVTNATISANSTSGGGAGIYNLSDGESQVTAITTGSAATVNMTNTIVGQTNAASTDFVSAVVHAGAGATLTGTNNLIANNAIGTSYVGGGTATGFTGGVSVADPNLGTLANNGGPTQTLLPLIGSPANGGGTAGVATDQRGVSRSGAANVPSIGAVQVPDSITTQPISQTKTAGQDVSFSAATYYGVNDAVQWSLSTDGGATFNPIDGATSPSLTLTNVSLSQSGNRYQATFTNAAGSLTTVVASLTVNPRPTVTNVSPDAGPLAGGTSVTITGTGFLDVVDVKFGDISVGVNYVVNSSTTITATSPAGSLGTVDVTVYTGSSSTLVSAADRFTYVSAPLVTSVTPFIGPTSGGNYVVIVGTNFTGATNVQFVLNNVPTDATSVTVNSDTQITALAPAGSSVVDVIVTNSSGSSTASALDSYTYAVPAVTSVVVNGAAIQTLTGATWTGGNSTVTVDSTAGLAAGHLLSSLGSGFPTSATVVAVTSPTTFTLSAAPSNTQSTPTTIRATNAPNASGTVLNLTDATWIVGSTTVTVADTTGLFEGQFVSSAAAGFPANAKVASVTDGTTFELSVAATATNNAAGNVIQVANGAVARDAFGDFVNLSGQGSVVEHVLVTFNMPVRLDSNADGSSQAFTVTSLAASVTALGIAPSTANVALTANGVTGTGNSTTGYSQYVLNFLPGSGVLDHHDNAVAPAAGNVFTTLADGFFQLNTVSSKIHSGVSDTAAPRAPDTFWSLYGAVAANDVQVTPPVGGGDDTLLVDGLALNGIYTTFGSNVAASPAYNLPYDWNLDGFIDGIDLTHLYTNFGTIWKM